MVQAPIGKERWEITAERVLDLNRTRTSFSPNLLVERLETHDTCSDLLAVRVLVMIYERMWADVV